MLMKLLKMLIDSGVYSKVKISKKLGIDSQLLDKMFEELIRLGYIEYENNKCKEICSCSKSACCCSNKNKIWKLTRKGENCIERF